ncbi:ABC transporter ATP-binding protein [Nocardioides sp. AX2bis]|uniref:ABC transporter ATP-binding protein n=1 Tax=Nocardioides sp. AX2bis TaxID=2653157 RepID=UPI001F2F9BE8|nr:ABC transporter ATP-binding protein [Nocardioides sp. AX2bis]
MGGRTVVEHVEIELVAGSMLAVVGVNGSGKSTVLRTVAGFLSPVAGRVRVYGTNVHALSARDRARRLAFVGQEERPPADMLVTEFVTLGRLPYRAPWSRGRDDHRRAMTALAQVGMQDAAHRACAELSGGERRRVSLARGLAQDCDVLVLDEPTNHLDVRHQIDLLTLLRNSGHTVVTAIHDLGLAASFFDRVLVLDRGRARAAAPPAQALLPATVHHVFGVHASALTDPTDHEHLVVGPGRTPHASDPHDEPDPGTTTTGSPT